MNGRRRALWWGLVGLVSLAPILLILVLIDKYAVNVPIHDEWDWSVMRVLRNDLPNLQFGIFWRLNNEHRVFIPKLIATALGHWTDLNMIVPMYVKVALTALVLVILTSVFVRWSDSPYAPWIAVPFSVLLFSLAQWPRWIDCRPLPSTLSVLSFAGAVAMLSSRTRSSVRFTGAAALAVVSALSYFSGNIALVVCGVLLPLFGWSRRHLYAWIGISLAVLIPYAVEFVSVETRARHAEVPGLVDAAEYFFTFLGATFSSGRRMQPNQWQAILFGVLGCASVVVLGTGLWRRFEGGAHKALPWLAIAAWVVINAAGATWGRQSDAGVMGARAYRYGGFSAIFWLAPCALCALVLIEPTKREGPGRFRFFALATLAMLLVGQICGPIGMYYSGRLDGLSNKLTQARGNLLLGEEADDARLRDLYHDTERIRSLIPKLVRIRASFLLGVRPLRLSDARVTRTDPARVTDRLAEIDGLGQMVIKAPGTASLSWTVTVEPYAVANFSTSLAAVGGHAVVRVSIRVERDGVSEKLFHRNVLPGEDGRRYEPLLVDLRAYRGSEIELTIELEGREVAEALLFEPVIVYRARH